LLNNREPKISDLEKSVFLKVIDGKHYEENNILECCIININYLAPEVFMGGKYGREADVWSMGLIFLEILTGKRIRQMM
jgi:serine/threonine protein kinase